MRRRGLGRRRYLARRLVWPSCAATSGDCEQSWQSAERGLTRTSARDSYFVLLIQSVLESGLAILEAFVLMGHGKTWCGQRRGAMSRE